MLDMRTITRRWIQKIEKLQEKTIQIIKFLPNNAQVLKEMHKLKIIKLKDFITLQNTCYKWLPWGKMTEKLQHHL